MDTYGGTALNSSSGAAGFTLVVVEPDAPGRMRIAAQLSGAFQPTSFSTLAEAIAVFQPSKPGVLVAGPGFASEHGLEQLHRFIIDRPEIGVVLSTTEISTPLLQAAMRCGVRDVVDVHLGDQTMRASVERVAAVVAGIAERAPGTKRRNGKLIVSFSTKGGVGKSTVATNLSVALAQRSERPVAIVDGDLQFGDVAVLLSVPPKSTVVDAAAAVLHDDPEFLKSLVTPHESGVLVLPAPVEPSAADQVRPEEMLAIAEALCRFCDFVVVDMPPHFDDMVLTLIEAADSVLLVASMDIPSIKNLKVGMQTLDLLSIAGGKLRLVLNRANAKVKLDVKEVERALGLPAEFPIPSDISVPQAVNRGVPVVLDNPKSPAAQALASVADTFIAELEAERSEGNEDDDINVSRKGRVRKG